MKFRTCFVVFVLLPFVVDASGWTHEAGSFYSEISFGFAHSDRLFNSRGGKVPIELPVNPGNILLGRKESSYVQQDISLYLEYGLGWDTQIQLSAPYVLRAAQEIDRGSYEVSGFSDLTVGLKHNWLNLPWIVSALEVTLGVPTGDENAKSNSVDNFVPQTIPLGDGEYDLLTRLHVSHGFTAVPMYVSTNVGYRFRDLNGGTGFQNDLHWGCDAGYSIEILKNSDWLPKITPTFAARGFHSLGSKGDVTNPALIFSGNVPGQSLIDIQPGLFISIWKKLALNTSYAYTVWGQNTSAGWTLRTGIAWEH